MKIDLSILLLALYGTSAMAAAIPNPAAAAYEVDVAGNELDARGLGKWLKKGAKAVFGKEKVDKLKGGDKWPEFKEKTWPQIQEFLKEHSGVREGGVNVNGKHP